MITAVDYFAGCGGSSTGALQAGVKVRMVANHWPLAVESHKLNYPRIRHVTQDLMLFNHAKAPQHDLFLASPSCKGFTKARGKERKEHDSMRATMWCVVSAAETNRPRTIVVENVHEVLDWGLWPAWERALTILGYSINVHLLDAADFGVSQNRLRAFILCTLDFDDVELDLTPWHQKHRNVRSCIDWAYPKWSRINKPDRSEKRKQQIKRGRKELGTDRFLIPYYGEGSGLTGRSLDRPCGTLVAQDVWAVVDGDRMRMLQPHEYRTIMGFPAEYRLAGDRRAQIRQYGNAVCPPVIKAFIEAAVNEGVIHG